MQRACRQVPDSLGTQRTHKSTSSIVCNLLRSVPVVSNHAEDTVTVNVNTPTEQCIVGNNK